MPSEELGIYRSDQFELIIQKIFFFFRETDGLITSLGYGTIIPEASILGGNNVLQKLSSILTEFAY